MGSGLNDTHGVPVGVTVGVRVRVGVLVLDAVTEILFVGVADTPTVGVALLVGEIDAV